MAIQTINNGETGLSVRNKINGNFAELQASVSGDQSRGRRVGGAGDSLMIGAAGLNTAAYNRAERQAAGNWQTVGNFAVGGTRTDQVAHQIPQVYAAGAGTIVINGGTNDIFQSVSEAALRTNFVANVTAVRALGLRYIDVGMPPSNVSTPVAARHAAHELWRGLYCLKNGIQHIDMWSPFATASGGWKSGANLDNTHWGPQAAKTAGDRINLAIRDPLSGYPYLLAMTDTADDVGTFVGNAVSYSGQSGATPANGWYNVGSGGTYSVQSADAGGFGSWYRCAVSGGSFVGMGANAVTLASLGWSIGDRLAFGFKLRWVDVSGALAMYVQVTGGVTGDQPLWGTVGGDAGDDITVYHEFVIAGGTAIGVEFKASGTGYFEVNRPVIVNLTKLGLA